MCCRVAGLDLGRLAQAWGDTRQGVGEQAGATQPSFLWQKPLCCLGSTQFSCGFCPVPAWEKATNRLQECFPGCPLSTNGLQPGDALSGEQKAAVTSGSPVGPLHQAELLQMSLTRHVSPLIPSPLLSVPAL